VAREYDCEEIRTLKGWIVLTAAGLLNNSAPRRGAARKARDAEPPSRFSALLDSAKSR
jgi:hypothetical protein